MWHMTQSQFSVPFQRTVSSPSESLNVYFLFVDSTKSKPECRGGFPHPGLHGKAGSLTRASECNSPAFLMPVASLELNSW